MNKEEILAKSRQDNKDKDLYELEVNKKASNIGSVSGIIICAILYATEIMVCGTQNYGLWSIIAAVTAGIYLYSGIKLRKKARIAVGAIWAVVTVITITSAIINIFDASTIL